jgi:serine/threonine protein kinase
MELADLGTLHDQLQLHLTMPAAVRFGILLNVATGMQYLHAHSPQPIIHHDLKTLNVLITSSSTAGGGSSTWVAKVSDFGMATGSGLTTTAQSRTAGAGTIAYSPPEVSSGADFTVAGDVFGFGMIISAVLTGLEPFAGRTMPQVMTLMLHKEQRPALPLAAPRCFSPEQWVFFLGLVPGGGEDGARAGGCWAQDASARPSFTELVSAFRAQVGLFPGASYQPTRRDDEPSGSGLPGAPMQASADGPHEMTTVQAPLLPQKTLRSGNVGKYVLGAQLQDGPNEGWTVESVNADQGSSGPGTIALVLRHTDDES